MRVMKKLINNVNFLIYTKDISVYKQCNFYFEMTSVNVLE